MFCFGRQRNSRLKGFSMKIEEVQRRLWEQSKEHREHSESNLPLFPVNPYDKRIRKLMDLIHNPTWLREAANRVLTRSYGKKLGVDGVTVGQFREKWDDNLEELRLELKRGTYRPKPVRQAMIPKANGQMRALGIPCLRDKIVQEAMRMALEPIFEVDFHDNSYGFRPNRSAHHAVHRCQQLIRNNFAWVIEGDVKACFDEISHKSILKAVREKVMDNKFLDLVELFLKAGISIEGKVHPTERGVPQGGVISPLLANAVLNKLDWYLHEKGETGPKATSRSISHGRTNIRFVRYADDWCVFITRGTRRYAERLRDEISEFLLRECGLRLSVEKTLITHIRDGFEFLGFELSRGIGTHGKMIAKIKVSRKAIRNFKTRLCDAVRHVKRYVSISARIYRASQVVRGWGEYFRIAHNFSKVAGDMGCYTFWTMVKTICRLMDIPTGKCLKQYYHKTTICYKRMEYLAKMTDITMKLDYRRPNPYVPGGLNTYEPDAEPEEKKYISEQKRPGYRDLKLTQLQQDQYRCRKCGKDVTIKDSELDHMIPIKNFPSYELANTPENLRTLCRECHRTKGDSGPKRTK